MMNNVSSFNPLSDSSEEEDKVEINLEDTKENDGFLSFSHEKHDDVCPKRVYKKNSKVKDPSHPDNRKETKLIPWRRKDIEGYKLKVALFKVLVINQPYLMKKEAVWSQTVDELFKQPEFAGYDRVSNETIRSIYKRTYDEKVEFLGLENGKTV